MQYWRVTGGCPRGCQSLGVSFFRYLNKAENIRLPVTHDEFLNGGRHARQLNRHPGVYGSPAGAGSFRQSLQMGTESTRLLKKVLKDKGLIRMSATRAFCPVSAIEQAGYRSYFGRPLKRQGIKTGPRLFYCTRSCLE